MTHEERKAELATIRELIDSIKPVAASEAESVKARTKEITFGDVKLYNSERTKDMKNIEEFGSTGNTREDLEFIREYRRLTLELLRKKIVNYNLHNHLLDDKIKDIYGKNLDYKAKYDFDIEYEYKER